MELNAIEFIKGNYQGRAIELEEKFKSVNIVLQDTLKDLLDDSKTLFENQQYNEVMTMIEVQKDLRQAINVNEEIISSLKVTDYEVDPVETLKDYDEYLVDTTIPHSLNEDFRFKRPFAFQLGDHYQNVSTWKDMLLLTCEHLNALNPKLFQTFTYDKAMKWGNTHKFSTDKELIRNPVEIGNTGVYVETSKDSIAVRQLIVRMLDKFQIKKGDYKVFLRADYTERYKQSEQPETSEVQ